VKPAQTNGKKKYEATLRMFTPPSPPSPGGKKPWGPLLLAGGVAGILGWIVTFPFDVIKTRMQAHDIVVLPVVRRRRWRWFSGTGPSTFQTACDMYNGGGRLFWRGLMPTMLRAVPVNMAVFGTFEAVVWACS
jgi:solute carrier family 25 (mitochondrial carnitine/acylcarnitine transporter), member 20/29